MKSLTRCLVGLLLLIAPALSQAAATDNAALLYYRTFWVLESKDIVDIANDERELPDEQRRTFLQQTKDVSALLVSAASLPKCDWGVTATNASGFGVAGVMSRVYGISRVAIKRFSSECLHRSGTDNPLDDLIASLALAKHLTHGPKLFVTSSTRAAIIQNTLIHVAAHSGSLSSRERDQVKNFILGDTNAFIWYLPEIIHSQVHVAVDELASLRKKDPLNREQVVQFLRQHTLSPQAVANDYSTAELLQKGYDTLMSLDAAAPLYAETSSTVLDRNISAINKRSSGLSTDQWFESFSSIWRKGQRTASMQSLLLLGLSAIKENSTIDDNALSALANKNKVHVARTRQGFTLKDHADPDISISLTFGDLQ